MADAAEVIRLLNDDLTGEVEAILVYMHAHFVLEGHCPTQLEMLEIALDEMKHAERLSEAIVDLGGTPELKPRQLRFAPADLKATLHHVIQLEKDAISQYTQHIEAIDDPKIKRLLNHIREDEEDHLEEFEELLEEAEE